VFYPDTKTPKLNYYSRFFSKCENGRELFISDLPIYDQGIIHRFDEATPPD
jgi:hypothetical protein